MLTLHTDDTVVKTFLFYSSILIAKTLAMELLELWQKMKFAIWSKLIRSNDNSQIKITSAEKVERIKRAHLNDIENIPIFVVIGLVYVLTKPDPIIVTWLLRIFVIARFVHTFVYAIYVFPQPARAIAFIAGEIVTWCMIIRGATYFYQ